MLEPTAPTRTSAMTRMRWVALIALAVLCWMSRMSLPKASATVELDPNYSQVLADALKHGLRFGREIVFTSGPLGYFPTAPYDPELYAAKFWLWEVLLGLVVAWLLVARLVRRGTWIDVGVGALVLIVLPITDDVWLFATGLLAFDVGLVDGYGGSSSERRGRRVLALTVSLLLMSMLTLVKVTSLSFALAAVAILAMRAFAATGVRGALRLIVGYVLVQMLVWLCIGQRITDLIPYFTRSIELASGFDSAMSQPPTTLSLSLCLVCLALGLALCAWHARGGTASARGFSVARAQAALIALALLLSYKAGFARASDHIMTFFGTAMIAPLFLISGEAQRDHVAPKSSTLLRAAVAIAAAICGLIVTPLNIRAPDKIASIFAGRLRNAQFWLSNQRQVHGYLDEARAKLAAERALPRTKAIVGSRPITAFSEGAGVIFLNDLHWKPRPVFQAFSVFTQRTARENAEFLSDEAQLDFVLWRQGSIDLRLPSSDDPLSTQVLLRDFRLRASEDDFLLLERDAPRAHAPRATLRESNVRFGERVLIPAAQGPLVLEGELRPSFPGKLRAALYQTPEVFMDLEFADGRREARRIAPFALGAGVVIEPWLPTRQAWIAFTRARPEPALVAFQFRCADVQAFEPVIPCRIVSAPDLERHALEPQIEHELLLGALGLMPLRSEFAAEVEFSAWESEEARLLMQAPAKLWYAVAAGKQRVRARLSVPPWIARASGFAGMDVLLFALESGARRECARIELRAADPNQLLDVELALENAAEVLLEIRPLAGGDPDTAQLGISKFRIDPLSSADPGSVR